MAEYAVNTDQLRSNADRIAALQRELDSVAVRLGAMQLGSVLQIKASTALIGRVGACKWAAAAQSDDLGRLARGLDDIARLYDETENNLADPKTQAQTREHGGGGTEIPEQSVWDDIWGGFKDIWGVVGEGAGPLAVLHGLFGWGDDWADDGSSIFGGIANMIFAGIEVADDAGPAEWAKALFGLNPSSTPINTWDDAVDDWLGKVTWADDIGHNAGVVCQWIGYGLSFISSGIDNYSEFDGDMANARFWGETVLEGVVDVGLGIGAGIAAAALLPTTWPAVVIGAAGAGVVWVANNVCEWITGGDDIGEVVANAVCDGVEATVEFVQDVGEAVADGVEAAWDGVCDWVDSWW